MKPRIQKRKAFTLVEILIVICVITILFVVLVSRVDFATDKARQAGVQNDMHAIQYAIHQVALEKGELVDDLNLLASLLNENLDTELMVRVEGNMLKTHATDPWGNEYQLRYNKGIDNKGQLQVFSAGPDSNYSTNDDTVIAIVCSPSASGTNVIVKEDLSTNEIIKEDGTLPNQPVAPEHVCSFNRQVQASNFLNTAGNCQFEATYFYSCSCGQKGTATFMGSKDPNTHVSNPSINYNSYNDEQHTKVTTCVGCNVVLDTSNINHTFNNSKCTDCNYERHTHRYVNENATEANKATSATCSAAATYYYTCACGAKGTSTFVSGNALAHNYSGRVTTDPTCTATGVRTYTCSTCNDTYTELVEVTPHNYNKQIEDGYLASAATCKDYAKYYYSCVCGKPGTQTFNGTELSSTHGDTETKYEYINESEHKVSSICKICNTTIQTITTGHGNLVNNKCSLCKGHVHSFTRQVENANTRVTEATCTKYATYKYSCADTTCNVLSDSSNTFEGSVYAAHIEANGKAENVHTKCSICGTTISSTHSYGTPVTTKAATCTSTGTQEKTCSCGYVKTETIAVLGHDLVSHAAKTATCTSIGWNAYETCNRCTYTTYKESAKKAHTSVNGGTKEVHTKCSVCNTTLSSNHSYTQTTTKEATCISTGTKKYSCTCGYFYNETIAVNSTKHSTSVTGYSYIDAVYHAYTTKCSACNKILSSGERYMHRLNTDDDYCEECYYTRPYVEPCIDSDKNNVCDNCNSKVLYGIWVFKDNPTYTKDMEQVIYFTTGSGLYCSGIKVWTDTMDIFVDYYEVFDTWSCWDNKCEGTWRSDNEKVNFGTQPQPVSTEFFNWVMANANREYAEVSGKWTFNTTLIDDVDFNQFVNFSINVNGEIVSYKNIYNYSGLVYFNSNSDYVIPYDTSWVNEEYMTIDFGNTPQEVFVVFYDWLIANATQQVYSLNGKWEFNDTLTQTGWASGDTSKYQLINFDLINGDNILDRNVFEYGVRDMYGCVYFAMHFNGETSGHLYSQYHWSSKNYGGCSTTTQSGWHSYWSDFIVDFGNEPQTVSQEFYEWFTANATQQIEASTFYIHTDNGQFEYQYESGMTFEDFINSPYNIDSSLYINQSGNISVNNAVYGPFDYVAPNIVKPEYPIDKDAYYGLAKSGLKCDKYYLSGQWQLKDSLTLPSNTIKQSVTFTENILGTITSLTIYNNNNETYIEVNTERNDTYLVYTGTWENGSPIINFGQETQSVSKEFYEWFIANATQICYLEGKWQFKDVLSEPSSNIVDSIEFIDCIDKTTCNQISITIEADGPADAVTVLRFNDDIIFKNNYWYDNTAAIIEFTSKQIVLPEFYAWFVLNATMVEQESSCAHSFTSTSAVAPTCNNYGLNKLTCSLCGYVSYEVISKLPHQLETTPPQEPTCTNNGKGSGKQCIVCKTYTVTPNIINKLGHNYKTTDSKPVSCLENGYIEQTCQRCNYVDMQLIIAQGHTDLIENGFCDNCNYQFMYTFIMDDVEYTYTYGMTWREWANSIYNADSYIPFSDTVKFINIQNNTVVTMYKLIFKNGGYTAIQMTWDEQIPKAYMDITDFGSLILYTDDYKAIAAKDAGYATYDDVANGLKNGELSLVLYKNKAYYNYDDIISTITVNVWINGGFAGIKEFDYNRLYIDEMNLEFADGSSAAIYYADANGNPIGDALSHTFDIQLDQIEDDANLALVISYIVPLTYYDNFEQKPLANGEIKIYNENGVLINKVITNKDGIALIPSLTPGVYTCESKYETIVLTVGVDTYTDRLNIQHQCDFEFKKLSYITIYDDKNNTQWTSPTDTNVTAYLFAGTYRVQLNDQDSFTTLIIYEDGSFEQISNNDT